MKADPPVRRDGRCACGCGKRRVMPKSHHSSIDPSVYALDPFASSTCCRRFHGVAIPKPNIAGEFGGKQGRHERVAA